MEEYVVLVDEKDREIGTQEKLQAHVDGALHRAFSVFIFNDRGEMLLQQRHPDKYHSGGLWSNACCSHPRPGESVADAARRRLHEEMGIRCALRPAFQFVYQTRLGDLYEHEYDHVFLGCFNGDPEPDQNEVADWRWASADALRRDVAAHPERYTYWFRLALNRVLDEYGE